MTIHHYDLNPHPFDLIKQQKKVYELRLYDQKRRLIAPLDLIEFTNNETQETLVVEVVSLHIFNNFQELFAYFPHREFGYENSDSQHYLDMLEYYPLNRQNHTQVVAIKIRLIS